MGLKRRFEKFYNRSTPLLSLQYWHQGECHGLRQITDNTVHFNPLFICTRHQATDVYYDINNSETDDELLVEYFEEHSDRFYSLASEYEKECERLLQLVDQAKPADIPEIYDLHVLTFSKLPIFTILGRLTDQKGFEQIAQHAYELRKKTDKVEYSSGNNLIDLACQLLPDFQEFIDVLTLEEIVGQQKIDIRELPRRKRGYIFFEGEVYANMTVKELESLKNITVVLTHGSDSDTPDSVCGQTARKGKAVGRVRIVLRTAHLDKVESGDIIVTPMTTPDYLAGMKRAAAFVTDEGGITCHAAIVAREMDKPCVIGTKVATQVLHDGDLVEVDADHGIVKTIR